VLENRWWSLPIIDKIAAHTQLEHLLISFAHEWVDKP
jgi:hypothetical protein